MKNIVSVIWNMLPFGEARWIGMIHEDNGSSCPLVFTTLKEANEFKDSYLKENEEAKKKEV